MTPEERLRFHAMLDSLGLCITEANRLLERVQAQLTHAENIRLLLLDWLERANEETP